MTVSSIPIHISRLCTSTRPSRTLDQFESRQEVLFALRDAIAGEFLVDLVTFCVPDAFYI